MKVVRIRNRRALSTRLDTFNVNGLDSGLSRDEGFPSQLYVQGEFLPRCRWLCAGFFAPVPPSSWMAPRAFERTSRGMLCTLCAVLACSAAFLRTSSSELPRASNLHPGFRSSHFRTFAVSEPP